MTTKCKIWHEQYTLRETRKMMCTTLENSEKSSNSGENRNGLLRDISIPHLSILLYLSCSLVIYHSRR